MNTKQEYQIIVGCTAEVITIAVNFAIKQGWEPIGGICLRPVPFTMYQSMVRTTKLPAT